MVYEVETNRLIHLFTPLFFGWTISLKCMSLTQDNSTESNFAANYVKNFMHAKSIHIYIKIANISPLIIAFVGHYSIGRESEQ